MAKKTVLIVGAGVSGLSSALLLADAGFDVSIWAKDLTLNTTSNVAAAFWYPYLCNPRDKAILWSKATYQYLSEHAIDNPDAGVRFIIAEDYHKEKAPDPWWRDAVEFFERPKPSELPKGYVDGYRTKGIVMDTSKYLPWLLGLLDDKQISITQKTLENFDEALNEFDVVVNCSGLGAKELCNDDRVYPVRGQVVRVEANGFEKVVSDESAQNPAYVIPRFNDIVIGGTAQPHDYNLEINPEDTKSIMRAIESIAPELTKQKILQEKVGLRPARDKIRLEAETINGKLLVHNYGHGGAGFTLSWGCAQDVVELVADSRA